MNIKKFLVVVFTILFGLTSADVTADFSPELLKICEEKHYDVTQDEKSIGE